MASRFWVLGTGSWNGTNTANWSATTGGAGGASVPTKTDDVFFDANSGGGTVTTSAVTGQCLSFNSTGFTGTIAMTASVTVNGPTFTLGASMSGTGMTGSANVNFGNATDTVTTTVTSNGKSISAMNINGTNVTVSLADALNCINAITHTTGTWLTNGVAVTSGSVTSTVGNARTVTLGNSAISAGTSWNYSTGTSLTVTANTATVTIGGANGTLALGGISWGGLSVVMNGSGTGTCNTFGSTLANLTRTGTASKTDTLSFTSTPPTVTGTLEFISNSATSRLLVQSGTVGTQRTIPCTGATVIIDNTAAAAGSSVDFQDINISGSPTWTVNNSTLVGDCGGNGGAVTTNVTTPVDQFLVMTGANFWSHGNVWFTTSGGAVAGRVPLPQDTVHIDANSGAFQITADMPRLGADLNLTGFTGFFNRTVNGLTSYGSWTTSNNMTMGGTVTQFFGGRGTHTFTTGGLAFASNGGITFQGPGGTYTLQDALNCGSGGLNLNDGTFNSGDFTITCTTFIAQSGRAQTVNLGTSTVNLTGTSGSIWLTSANPAPTYNTSSATVLISVAATATRTIATTNAVSQTIGTVTYTVANSPGILLIQPPSSGGATIGTINVNSTKQLQFFAGRTVNITNWNVNGVNNGYLYLPGVAGNYVSTPDSAALSVTGDIDIVLRVLPNSWTPAAEQEFLGKWITGQQSYLFALTGGTKKLRLYVSSTGANSLSTASSVTIPFADGTAGWIRATWRASDGRVQFFTAADAVAVPSAWTQLGTDLTIAASSLFDSTAILEVGSWGAGVNSPLAGKFYRAQVYDGIGGTLVFDADFTTKTVGANTFTESSANAATVTINGVLAQAGDGRVDIRSSSAGVQATLSKSSGIASSDYLVIKDINAIPSTSSVGQLVKQTQVPLSGILSFAGAIAKAVTRSLSAALSFTGSIAKKTVRAVTAALSFAGSFLAGALHHLSLTAALSFTAAFSKATNMPLTAALSFTGKLVKTTTRALTAALSFTGNIAKQTAQAFTASLSFVGSIVTVQITHFHAIALSASLSFTGKLNKKSVKSFTAAISFIGSFITSLPPRFMVNMVAKVLGGRTTSTVVEGKQFTDVSTGTTLEGVKSGSSSENLAAGTVNTTVKSSNTNEEIK